MGFIIRSSNRDPWIFSCAATRCSLGLDPRGLLSLGAGDCGTFLKLFSLENSSHGGSRFTAHSPELTSSGEPFSEGACLDFTSRLIVKWRDTSFDILDVSSAAFMLAKISNKELLKKQADYRLECKALNLSVPVFSGTRLTIGSHPSDSIYVPDSAVKPKHALIKVNGDSSRLEISGHMGNAEIREEGSNFYITLIPSRLEFEILAIRHCSE